MTERVRGKEKRDGGGERNEGEGVFFVSLIRHRNVGMSK